MTAAKNLKKRIRARIAESGESYATARRHVLAGHRSAEGAGTEPPVFLFPWEERVWERGRQVKGTEAHSVGFYRIATDHEVPPVPVEAGELRAALGHRDPFPPLSIPMVDDAPLVFEKPGLVIVTGRGASGMTVITTLLAASMPDRSTLTRVGVPEDYSYQAMATFWGATLDAALRSPMPYHLIDSLSLLTASGGRPFVEDGIPVAFYRLVRDLARLARACSRLVIATADPMIVSREARTRFREIVKRSGASVIETLSCDVSTRGDGPSEAHLEGRAWIRKGKRPPRERLVRLRFDNAAALDDVRGTTTRLSLDLSGSVTTLEVG